MLARLRSYVPTAVLAFLIFYFGFQALTGDRGLLSLNRRNETLEAKTIELARLRSERQELQVRARLLRDDHLSADLLDERARSLLGFADPRDYVIRTGG
jgi:cell division protein FtsB